jgi:hypothetical protein
MAGPLERGDVSFLYRPKLGIVRVRSLDDVQRFFIVLARRLTDGHARVRRIIVGRKRLPDPGAHEREWAFVADVTERPDEAQADARVAGAGAYAIAEHEGHVHFEYVLASRNDDDHVRALLNVRDEASYVVAVRNPEAPAPAGAGLSPSQRPHFPPDVLERFRGRRFLPLDDPALLDQPGVELVLIGATEDAELEREAAR